MTFTSRPHTATQDAIADENEPMNEKTETTSKPHPNYTDFEEFVSSFCFQFGHLIGCSEEQVRNGVCDLAELRKAYDAGELSGDVAWNEFEAISE